MDVPHALRYLNLWDDRMDTQQPKRSRRVCSLLPVGVLEVDTRHARTYYGTSVTKTRVLLYVMLVCRVTTDAPTRSHQTQYADSDAAAAAADRSARSRRLNVVSTVRTVRSAYFIERSSAIVRRPTYTILIPPPLTVRPLCRVSVSLDRSNAHLTSLPCFIICVQVFARPPLPLKSDWVCTDHTNTRTGYHHHICRCRNASRWPSLRDIHHHGSRRDQTQFREERLLVNYHVLSL